MSDIPEPAGPAEPASPDDVDGAAEFRRPPDGAVALGHDTYYTKVIRGGVWAGIHEWHNERGEYEPGYIAFTGRAQPDWFGGATWDVVSEDPLTLSPSLACGTCGHHGWIRDGQWVPA